MNNSLFEKDLWREIFHSLKANGFRTVVTAFGVFWGVFILVLLLSASSGFQTGVLNKFEGTSTNSIFVWIQKTSIPYKGLPKNRTYRFKIQDAEAIKNHIKGIKVVSPQNSITTTTSHYLKNGEFKIEGDFPEILLQKSLKSTQGRFINQLDINSSKKVAVIGWAVVDELFKKNEQVVGSYINIKGIAFKVIGVYKDTSMRGRSDIEQQKAIHIPFTTFSKTFNKGNKVSNFYITAEDNFPITDLKEDVLALLRKRHKIHPEDDRAIGHFDLNSFFVKFNMMFTALKGVSYFVGILILMSGIIGISNIMLIVIKERTKEIGIKRAIGATPGIIKKQILLESVVLTLISGMCGVIFSAFILYIANKQIDAIDPMDRMISNAVINIPTVIIIILILVVFGLFAGVIPAKKAVKMKPIDAIRTE